MAIGGSAGHSGAWNVDVDAGVLDADLAGRKWVVRVTKSTNEDVEPRRGSAGDGTAIRKDILDFLENHLGGETRSGICRALGGNKKRVHEVLCQLVDEGIVLPVNDVLKGGGQAGDRQYNGYRLASAVGMPTAESNE